MSQTGNTAKKGISSLAASIFFTVGIAFIATTIICFVYFPPAVDRPPADKAMRLSLDIIGFLIGAFITGESIGLIVRSAIRAEREE